MARPRSIMTTPVPRTFRFTHPSPEETGSEIAEVALWVPEISEATVRKRCALVGEVADSKAHASLQITGAMAHYFRPVAYPAPWSFKALLAWYFHTDQSLQALICLHFCAHGPCRELGQFEKARQFPGPRSQIFVWKFG